MVERPAGQRLVRGWRQHHDRDLGCNSPQFIHRSQAARLRQCQIEQDRAHPFDVEPRKAFLQVR